MRSSLPSWPGDCAEIPSQGNPPSLCSKKKRVAIVTGPLPALIWLPPPYSSSLGLSGQVLGPEERPEVPCRHRGTILRTPRSADSDAAAVPCNHPACRGTASFLPFLPRGITCTSFVTSLGWMSAQQPKRDAVSVLQQRLFATLPVVKNDCTNY